MDEEKGKVVLVGKRWSGRSTLTNMLVNGGFKDCPMVPIDTTSICETYVGRGWTVVDTMGFGEVLVDSTVPSVAEFANKMVMDFLNEVKGRYTHIIFVVEYEDIAYRNGPNNIWETFLETFTGGEENFVVLVTKVRSSVAVHALANAQKMFSKCKQFVCVDFPEVDTNDPQMEELKAKMRQDELEIIEKKMKEMFKASPWVEPDISKMGNKEIEEKARRITQQISGRTRMIRTLPDHVVSIDELRESWERRWQLSQTKTLRLSRSILRRQASTRIFQANSKLKEHHQIQRDPLSNTAILRHRSEEFSRICFAIENMGKKVKFYSRQCDYLLRRSLEVLKECLGLCNRREVNWELYCLPPLFSALDKLECCMDTTMELLELCGEKNEQEVAFMLSPPHPFENSLSRFALVLRELDWSIDAFRFLVHNPKAGHAAPSERQSWLSKFSWCEERCRLVHVTNGKNKIADANDAESSPAVHDDRQARDRQDLISYHNGRKTFHTQNRSELDIRKSILKNRFHTDFTFSDPSKIPGCFLIPEKLRFEMLAHIGGGSYKAVHKCKWLGMEVAIASLHKPGEEAKMQLETEVKLLARVQHPNVLTLIGYSFDEEEQKGHLVTEIMETDLRTLVEKSFKLNRQYSRYLPSPFSILEAVDILLQVVEAMIHVHECGVIHRDLKALNCLINREAIIHRKRHDHVKRHKCSIFRRNFQGYVVKLIDFGESKLRSSEMGSNFNTRNRGTRAWMAPEVIGKGDEINNYTWSADVYSFGMTCYEILTGETPFSPYRGPVLKDMIRAGERPTIPDDCPNGLRNLMTQCWAHSPEERPTFKDIRQILWNCKLYYTIWGTRNELLPRITSPTAEKEVGRPKKCTCCRFLISQNYTIGQGDQVDFWSSAE